MNYTWIILLAPTIYYTIKKKQQPIQTIYHNLVLTTIILSISGLILASTGLFSINTLVLIFIATTPIFIKYNQKLKHEKIRKKEQIIILIVVLIAGILFFTNTTRWVGGGRDHGVYVAIGNHIYKNGSIKITDSVMKNMNQTYKNVFYRLGLEEKRAYEGSYFPGFYITNATTGEVTPQFLHLYPVWIAIFQSISGTEAIFYVNSFFSIISLLGLYFFSKKILNWKYAFLLCLLFILNFSQIWYARSTFSEIINQALLLGGLTFLAKSVQERGLKNKIISATCFGLSLFTRIDSITIFASMIMLTITYLLTDKKKFKKILPIMIILVIFIPFYFNYLETQTNPYISDLTRSVRKTTTVNETAKVTKNLDRLMDNLYRTSLYMTKTGFLFSLLGIVLMISILLKELKDDKSIKKIIKKHNEKIIFISFSLLLFLFYLPNARIAPDQPWWARRYVLLIFPSLLIYLVYFIKKISTNKIGKIIAIGLYTYVLITFVTNSLIIINYTEGEGMMEGMGNISEMIGDSITICPDTLPMNIITTPLYFMYNRQVILLRHKPNNFTLINQQIKNWLNENKTVKILTYDYEQVPSYQSILGYELEKEFAIEYRGDYTWAFNHLRESNGLPNKTEKIQWPLRLYKIKKEEQQLENETIIDIGKNDYGNVISGFNEAQHEPRKDYRYTKENATIYVEHQCSQNTTLIIRAGAFRPASVESAKTDVYVNGQLIGNFTTHDGLDDFNFTTLPIGNELIINLVTNTYTPSERIESPDNRELGIQLSMIKLIN